MESKRIPMTIKEFEIMEHPFGYKAEYWDGKAVFTPREQNVTTKLNIVRRSIKTSYNLMPINPSFKPQMIEAFFESFQDSVEFCDWPQDKIRAHAEKIINDYFAGVRGKPHPVSVTALEPDKGDLAGLALFLCDRREQINLDLLFVMPSYQRKKAATEMVSSAVNRLYEDGIRELYSAYHICNEGSSKWHRSFGFEDVYDQLYIRLKYSWCRHEIWRHEKLGLNNKAEELIKERDYWYSQLEDVWKY